MVNQSLPTWWRGSLGAFTLATVAANSNTRAMEANAQASRLAAAQRANLIFQLKDVGVSLASGMSPLMVAIQQGSQIATIYGPSGLGKALAETGRMAAAMAVRFAPLVAVLAAGYGAYKLLKQYSAEAAVAIDSATAALAAQAAPLSEVKSGIGELVSLQGEHMAGSSGRAVWSWFPLKIAAGRAMLRSARAIPSVRRGVLRSGEPKRSRPLRTCHFSLDRI
ncbi:MAG: hypothetical protein EOS09_36345 [Mesorhizobium sp.]|nr:MAG: hypothetical protein EOR98_36405 [Mesorhizobium sp.]RWN68071.1 MAG: hypothetical protein EOS02_36185 [Mesorhizobium sp.]RWN75225.1 MAG: hypothetical protein EOS01_23470 [Mesorhizobium sp.]RWN77740.1 MAG: hypothetical protein EOS04_36385 [Mesorhizobium sp.]RWO10637.1 MAG: hypothetical protein EOS15_24255 [Mesorhizobium sp.]